MLGCDYCETIRGIGPKRALELVEQYKNIETILKNIDLKKYTVPEDWNFEQARQLFMSPEITDPEKVEVGSKHLLKWNIAETKCWQNIILNFVSFFLSL